MLLHLAGPYIQEIFSNLADTVEATDYAAAVTALNGYFLPKVNTAFTRQKFYRLQQKEGETVLQFVTRLRKEGKDCNFGADFDNKIRDAVLCKCRSDYVRRKQREERVELTLARTLEIAEQCESVAHQMSHLSGSEPSKEDARTWEDLKVTKIKCKSEVAPFDRKLYAYASSKPLSVKGRFICESLIGKGKPQTEFLVIKGKRSATPFAKTLQLS